MNLALCAALAAACLQVQFDAARTRIEFTLSDVLHTVHGTFKLKSGVIDFDPATGAATGKIVVDATSGESGSGGRDRRMHKNILESDRYSEITFVPDHVEGKLNPGGDATLQVHGLFGIHGAEHEITLPFQIHESKDTIEADTTFPVPYVKWGMKNPSTLFLRVSDTVQIHIHTAGHPNPCAGSDPLTHSGQSRTPGPAL